jgi:hypothetical protein
VAKEFKPQAVFDRLFGNGDTSEENTSRSLREKKRKSILDFARDEAQSLNRKLGAEDQRKVEEYLYAIRDVERRLKESPKLTSPEKEVPDFPRPGGMPSDFAEHIRQMMDMMVLAMQTDSTRLITFMYTNDSSNRSYPNLSINAGHHDLSHHGGSSEKQQKVSKINVYHAEQLAYFIGKLKSVKEGSGTLLDHALILYGSGIADGDSHAHHDLPILLIGRGGGALRPGKHLRFPKDTPLCNLYVWMLNRLGVRTDKFGDSTGKLDFA